MAEDGPYIEGEPDALPVVSLRFDHRENLYDSLTNAPGREQVEQRIGSRIPDEIWDFEPWGARILVRRDKAEEKIGSIYIPDDARDTLQSGVIVKVGPMVGVDGAAQSGVLHSCPYPDPADLVGLPVIFGTYAGKVLVTSEDRHRDPYSGHWLLMTEEDIWGHSNREPEVAPKEGS